MDLRRLADEHVAPRAIPRAPTDRILYGLVQPLLGARVLFGDRALMKAALVPAGLLAAACAVVALIHTRAETAGAFLRTFYTTFAVLAPLPSVLLARHYARFAVLARARLGFAAAEPCLEPLRKSLRRAISQTILIALALAPVGALLKLVPVAGPALTRALAAVWALHWIFVDAFDSARFLRPGQTVAELDAHAQTLRAPWFVRGLERAAERAPIGRRLARRFARACDRLAMPWREEISLIEDHPSLTVGFALATAALLALPALNLLFRPIVIVGAAHVLGRLEQLEPDAAVLPPAAAAEG